MLEVFVNMMKLKLHELHNLLSEVNIFCSSQINIRILYYITPILNTHTAYMSVKTYSCRHNILTCNYEICL